MAHLCAFDFYVEQWDREKRESQYGSPHCAAALHKKLSY